MTRFGTIDGKRVDLDPDQWWFTRDHRGAALRPGGGSPAEGGQMQPGDIPAGALYHGDLPVDDELVHFAQREDHLGNRSSSRAKCSP